MEKTRLLVKNIPEITEDVRQLFVSRFAAKSVKSYGRRRAVLSFADERSATSALHMLHQSEFGGRLLFVEYLGAGKQALDNKQNDIVSSQQIPDLIKELYATSFAHGFEQPPPPYLKYNYPPINRTILDSISIALLTNHKFYYQVLHLMNRMNLEPPFLPLEKPFVPPGEPCDAQTQTECEISSKKLLASDESELESDEDNVSKLIQKTSKRKATRDDSVIKDKIRKIISSQLPDKQRRFQPSARKEQNIREVFEDDAGSVKRKISLNVSTITLPSDNVNSLRSQPENMPIIEATTSVTTLVGEELLFNRIPESQWRDLAVFKNYRRGERSNKLYVKNLSKDVSVGDLETIYSRFMENKSDISVKLMQFGKMKGQAFITFNNLRDNYDVVEKALVETNGYILKNKPLVVCFGKKS